MTFHAAFVGKYALLACNFIFLLSGLCLVALGCILAHDTPRLLLSILAVQPGDNVQPLLYYMSLGFILIGMLVCVIAAVGCWAGCVAKTYCLMSLFMFLLIVLLMAEISFGVVATLCPQLLGVNMDRDTMVENLQRNYGLPARDRYTAAVDLAQTLFECCGMISGTDYDESFWREREIESKREWRVPRSCCVIQNTRDVNAFLDPQPLNDTLCQAKSNAMYQRGRHTVGCVDELDGWFEDHSTIFLTMGLSLIVVQLCVLISSIFYCVKRRKKASTQSSTQELPDNTSQPRTTVNTSLGTMRSDEVYPDKTSHLTNLPLALLNGQFVSEGQFYQPKMYNNEQNIMDNLRRHNNQRDNNNLFGQFNMNKGD